MDVAQSETPRVEMSKCVLCDTYTSERLIKITDVGLESLRNSCEIRQRHDVLSVLHSSLGSVYVHGSCRKSFTRSSDLKRIKLQLETPAALRSLRSTTGNFDWKTMCFICGCYTTDNSGIRHVCTLELGNSIVAKCAERGDSWATEVRGRIENCIDLVAEEAVYHSKCHVRFVSNLPQTSGDVSSGRREREFAMTAFDRMCYILETSCEENVYTLDDLYDTMKHEMYKMNATTDDMYSSKHIKRLLIERYGDNIFFAEVTGRTNVVCFKDLCKLIVSDSWYHNKKHDDCSMDERIVKDAARLIASEIRELNCSTVAYPSVDNITGHDSQHIPPLLSLMVKSLIRSPLKQIAIAQAIIQAAKPQSAIMPILFGLGVQLDYEYGSEMLLQILSRLGFCISYDEVTRFKRSAMQFSGADSGISSEGPRTVDNHNICSFTQFVADNVDHNIRTVDGKDSFHGMGIISATVSATVGKFGECTGTFSGTCIPRSSSRITVENICKDVGIPVVAYNGKSSCNGEGVVFRNIRSLKVPATLPPIVNLNLLWHVYGLNAAAAAPRPNWNGFMQSVCTGKHSAVAALGMLPIINLKPSDESCVYSTLLFLTEQAKKLCEPVAVVTFDQPLYIKALHIATDAKLNVVVRLGAFHTLMNFLGAIGDVMRGSGLEELLGVLYGTNTVDHVMTGKAFARAVRGHILIHDALLQMLLQHAASDDFSPNTIEDTSCESPILTKETLHNLYSMYDEAWSDKVVVDDCSELQSTSLCVVEKALQHIKESICSFSRTSKLWLLYVYYIDVVKLFLLGERTSDWSLHLTASEMMLNLFAATGHYNYAKSCRIYVQNMRELSKTCPILHDHFVNGKHSVRRSDRMWAGLSTDLLIEQTLMKCVKGRGGLTRGRGMHETVRHVWTGTMSICATIHFAMLNLTNLCQPDVAHVEVGSARMKRDAADLTKLKMYLTESNPFMCNDKNALVSLSSGIIAGPTDDVNCEYAEEVGFGIQQKWDGLAYKDVVAKKKSQVRTLAHLTNTCAVGTERVYIDVNRLFHRLIIVAERSGDIRNFFKYELTQFPTSLFADGFMRKPDKRAIYRNLLQDMTSETVSAGSHFVVDGGCLLHKVRWNRGSTCDELLQQYVSYVRHKFGSSVVVVFDGYEDEPSPKDHEHRRRQKRISKMSPVVNLKATKQMPFEQEQFFANMQNKASFIEMLMTALSSVGIDCHKATGDADTLIVAVTLQYAASHPRSVTVYADDTDLLCMLLYHRSGNMSDIYFLSETKKGSPSKCILIRAVQEKLGYSMCQHILVLHALGGCDTTSAIFGHGKGTIFARLTSNSDLGHSIAVMQDIAATHAEIGNAGLQLLLAVYNGKESDNLDDLRYLSYCRLVSLSLGKLQPEKLPPSQRAAYYHGLRVHWQSVEWKTLSASSLPPTQWGWRLEQNQLVPITTDLPVAPEEIMNVVRCGCKARCNSAHCTCRKNGLTCMSACVCHGTDCDNAQHVSIADTILLDGDIDIVDEEVVVMSMDVDC